MNLGTCNRRQGQGDAAIGVFGGQGRQAEGVDRLTISGLDRHGGVDAGVGQTQSRQGGAGRIDGGCGLGGSGWGLSVRRAGDSEDRQCAGCGQMGAKLHVNRQTGFEGVAVSPDCRAAMSSTIRA